MSLQQALFNKCYEYIVNHNGIPYIYINTKLMPQNDLNGYVDAGQNITLNISMSAVTNFRVEAEGIHVSLKFRGVPVYTFIPYIAIRSMYDKNNTSIGMLFNNAFLWVAATPSPIPPPTVVPIRKKPTLTLVK